MAKRHDSFMWAAMARWGAVEVTKYLGCLTGLEVDSEVELTELSGEEIPDNAAVFHYKVSGHRDLHIWINVVGCCPGQASEYRVASSRVLEDESFRNLRFSYDPFLEFIQIVPAEQQQGHLWELYR